MGCQICLESYVFGAWGEASPDVERLLHVFATCGAHVHWREMGAEAPEEARGALAWLLRRRWAMTALRENARLKFVRMEHVGGGAAMAAGRRATFLGGADAGAHRAACCYWQGPQLPYGVADW